MEHADYYYHMKTTGAILIIHRRDSEHGDDAYFRYSSGVIQRIPWQVYINGQGTYFTEIADNTFILNTRALSELKYYQ
jgi:hypothetical protein